MNRFVKCYDGIHLTNAIIESTQSHTLTRITSFHRLTQALFLSPKQQQCSLFALGSADSPPPSPLIRHREEDSPRYPCASARSEKTETSNIWIWTWICRRVFSIRSRERFRSDMVAEERGSADNVRLLFPRTCTAGYQSLRRRNWTHSQRPSILLPTAA